MLFEVEPRSVTQAEPAPPAPDSPHDFTMASVLDSMQAREEFLESADFDPAKFVGKLDPMDDIERLKMKVQNTVAVVEDAKAYAARMKAKAKQYADKASAAANKAQRILEYVQFQMEFHKFERLPGLENAFVRTRASNPELVELREATPADYARWPELVEVTPRKYSFKNAETKALLKAAAKVPADSVLVVSPDAEIPDAPKPGIMLVPDFARIEYSHSVQIALADQMIPSKKKGK